jgi:hypothetical protein
MLQFLRWSEITTAMGDMILEPVRLLVTLVTVWLRAPEWFTEVLVIKKK